MSERKILRCAIYTRKSSEEGLEQDFNSLEAQREACEAYVRSQGHEGWRLLPEQFNDGGFSGGNMERPALRELVEAVRQRRLDIIVVYKIDRLTRSLTDFAKLAEVLDQHGVSFVSVTQQFNTTTSMGRLMLNVLLSFAQFEREITGERIRDKIAASKKKGMWMGGVPPMGYDIVDRRLVVNETDATTIRRIFTLYLEQRSVPALLESLEREGIRTAARYSAKGNHYGNRPFARGHLYKLLSSPIYVGRVPHKSASHDGQHVAIVDHATWDAVQALLTDNTQGSRRRSRRSVTTQPLLEGKIYTPGGNLLVPNHARKGARRYSYYVEQMDRTKGVSRPLRLPRPEIEAAVVEGIKAALSDQPGLVSHVAMSPSEALTITTAAEQLVTAIDRGPGPALIEKLRMMLRAATMGNNQIELQLSVGGLRALLGCVTKKPTDSNTTQHDNMWIVSVPMQPLRRGRQLKLVASSNNPRSAPNRSLLRAVVRAWDWAERLKSGEAATISQICAEEEFTDTYVGQVVPLAFLAPAVVEQILAGRQSVGLTANRLVWGQLPASWEEQITNIG